MKDTSQFPPGLRPTSVIKRSEPAENFLSFKSQRRSASTMGPVSSELGKWLLASADIDFSKVWKGGSYRQDPSYFGRSGNAILHGLEHTMEALQMGQEVKQPIRDMVRIEQECVIVSARRLVRNAFPVGGSRKRAREQPELAAWNCASSAAASAPCWGRREGLIKAAGIKHMYLFERLGMFETW